MRNLLTLASLTLLATTGFAQVPPSTAPQQRTEVLGRARDLLAAKDPTIPSSLKDPFHSTAFVEAVSSTGVAGPVVGGGTGAATAPERPAGPRGKAEILAAIGEGLRPSGYIIRGGVASIAFGQKRVKAGDTLTINFEGTEYTLEITALDRANFTIRLGNEEFTRTIR